MDYELHTLFILKLEIVFFYNYLMLFLGINTKQYYG